MALCACVGFANSGPHDNLRYNWAIMTMTKRSQSKPDKLESQVAMKIAILAFEGISPFHLAVPSMVFGENRSDLGVPPFAMTICAESPGKLRTSVGFDIDVKHGLEAFKRADIVIVPSWTENDEAASPKLMQALRNANQRGARIVGLCLGAIALAQAGLLDGKIATTHWAWAQRFADRFPKVKLDPSVLYVEDGNILTSAGTAAGLDCCLYLLRQLCGAEIANRVARRLVVAPHREGGQAQFIEHPLPVSRNDAHLSQVFDWVSRNLADTHSVDSLAERARMSRRTFTRRFRQATGTTVVQWILHQRLAMAQRLLETSNRSIELIAAECGFGTSLSLRQHFNAAFHTTPSTYRKLFQAQGK